MPSTNIGHLYSVARSSFITYEDFIRACRKEFPTNLPIQENDKICKFCKKTLGVNFKIIKPWKDSTDKIYICNNCKNLYQTIKREYKANNKHAIKNIIWFIE